MIKIKNLLTILGLFLIVFAAQAHLLGSHNIDTNSLEYHWAWNDVAGWIDFHANNTIEVGASELRGWAESSLGPIVLNCATTPNGDVCDPSNGNFKISNAGGALSGWAWNDLIGWISFNCQDLGVCGPAPYQVTIVPSGGESFFKGWAWNEIIGWISFHCENHGNCDNLSGSFANHKIQTSAGSVPVDGGLESNVFDTNVSDPHYNYIMWKGTPKTDTSVQLQVASSDSSIGPWVFDDPVSVDVSQRFPIASQHQGMRYIKYCLLLSSDPWQSETPIIDDVIINYSP